MKKNILILLALIVLIAIIFGGLYLSGFNFGLGNNNISPVKQDAPSGFAKELPAPKVKISNYVLGGKVISISGNILNVNSQRVMVGPNGNFITNDAKTVTIASSTQVYITSMIKGKFTRKLAKTSDIKAGDNINMSSTEDIAKLANFTPQKIEISR